MRVLVDTNVIIDYIANRSPYSEDAYRIFELCVNKKITGCIAAHTIINLFYILRKELSVDERKSVMKTMCQVFNVVGVDRTTITSALDNDDLAILKTVCKANVVKRLRLNISSREILRTLREAILWRPLQKSF